MQKKVEDFKSSANYCDRMVISYVAQNLFPPSVNNYRASGDDLTARVPQKPTCRAEVFENDLIGLSLVIIW
jgi:hypothetical protein